MVLNITKWNIMGDKTAQYLEWAPTAVQRTTGAPGVIEFRAYRPASGSHQVVITYEFADLATWAAWWENEDVQQAFQEARNFATDVETEVWGPSPVVPEPIRPAG